MAELRAETLELLADHPDLVTQLAPHYPCMFGDRQPQPGDRDAPPLVSTSSSPGSGEESDCMSEGDSVQLNRGSANQRDHKAQAMQILETTML